MKVKIIEGTNSEVELEQEINAFIQHDSAEVIDIQYRTAYDASGQPNLHLSAMIIYKNKED